jgi:predicted permease
MRQPARDPRPPRAALAWLTGRLPLDQRDVIVGDLIETFADREDAGRRFNRLWFWAQTIGFVLGFAPTARHRPVSHLNPATSGRLTMGRFAIRVRQTVRRLAFEWRYAVGIVLILGVGIGPASAMLSVVQKVLLQPLPYRAPDRLGLVRLNLGQIQNHPGLSLSEIQDFRKTQGLFAAVESEARTSEVSLGPPDNLVPLSAVNITPGMLPMLGVTPILGHQFTEADANNTMAPPVLLDYGVWQTHFGAARDIVGRTVLIDGRGREVVGVLPRGFTLVTGRAVPRAIDIYLPLRVVDFRNFWAFPTIVRLKDGVSFTQANLALEPFAASLVKAYPKDYSDARLQFVIHPLLDDVLRDTRPALRAAMGGVLLLLVIAIANATALAVARLKTREREFAIRSAIGAGQGALVADVLLETAVLSVWGTCCGSGLAVAAIIAARGLVPHTVPRWDQIGMSWELVAYSAGFALLALLVSGLIPVWKVARGSTWQTLRSGTVQGGRAEGAMTRLLLVGGQIALTVVLAFGAVQLVRSAARLREVHLGFDPNVLTFRVPFDFRIYDKPEKGALLYERIRDRLRQVPGVLSVGAVSHVPLSGSLLTDAYTADLTKTAGWDQAVANYYAVTPGYFTAMRISVLKGRDFTDVEDSTGQHVVIVDETLTGAAFPGVSDVIGRTLRLGYGIPDSRIIGVVNHVRGIEVGREVRPQVYVPFGTFTWTPLTFTVRATGDPWTLVSAVQAAVHEVGPGRALTGFAMLTDNVTAATSTLRAVTSVVSCLAIVAGLLSAIGLYSVIAFVVHQRRRATAIRSALGASPAQLVWHHLKTGGAVMLAALPIGVALAVTAAPFFGALVYGVAERDLTSLAVAAVVAATTGILGTYVPVRRAGDTDPVTVLRGD